MSRPDFEGDDWELTIDKSVYDQSSIKVRMDITNQHIAFTLQVKFVEAFENFTKQLVRNTIRIDNLHIAYYLFLISRCKVHTIFYF